MNNAGDKGKCCKGMTKSLPLFLTNEWNPPINIKVRKPKAYYAHEPLPRRKKIDYAMLNFLLHSSYNNCHMDIHNANIQTMDCLCKDRTRQVLKI
jgi:hypothetical protein